MCLVSLPCTPFSLLYWCSLTAWRLKCGFRLFRSRGFSILIVIFRGAGVNITYSADFSKQRNPIEKSKKLLFGLL